MMRPNQTKYRKHRKIRVKGIAQRSNRINFGSFGLKAMEGGLLTGRQLEAARISLNRKLKRAGRIWIMSFPQLPVSAKPSESRMGKGKGAVSHFVCPVKPGTILYEVDGVVEQVAKRALTTAAKKLPIKTVFVKEESISSTV